MADTFIILQDGSWGVLAGATIFTVPENFQDEFDALPDERGIFDALNAGTLTAITSFTTNEGGTP